MSELEKLLGTSNLEAIQIALMAHSRRAREQAEWVRLEKLGGGDIFQLIAERADRALAKILELQDCPDCKKGTCPHGQ